MNHGICTFCTKRKIGGLTDFLPLNRRLINVCARTLKFIMAVVQVLQHCYSICRDFVA